MLRTKNPAVSDGIVWLSDQGSNLDFPESKSGVLPVTPSDRVFFLKNRQFGTAGLVLGGAKVEEIFKKH